MSGKTNRKMILAMVVLLVCVQATIAAGEMIITVDVNGSADYDNIQEAIDNASNGDVVVVNPGTYSGEGNRDIDFLGKAITVQSLDPGNNTCMRETIIDAEGQGVIVRFVNDEGPKSVFAGFSLLAGDTSAVVRGMPGFFEFSANAKPTTKRLRIAEDLPPSPSLGELHTSQTETLLTDSPYGGRVWEGNNPFHQPAATTDYYGSGDVDNDGHLTPADASLAQEIANGTSPLCIRADVDGDGDVDNNDVSLINGVLGGETLPSWWNSLVDKAERNAWVDKLMAVDKTDQHPYRYWFQCLTFATQTHIDGAFYRRDLYQTVYDKGQAFFNVPMYVVAVPIHAINGILVGDDPLNFDDWRFLEPQDDRDVHPGGWNMPFGGTVRVFVPSRICSGSSYNDGYKVSFYVDETGWTLQEHDPDLILTRPSPDGGTTNNLPDLWNPRIVPTEPNSILLFERYREDMFRSTDIHFSFLPFIDPPEGLPLVGSSSYSRLLDVCQGPDGDIHLLWKGKPDYIPGVFHGKLNPLTYELSDVTRVCTGTRVALMGRVIVTAAGEVHVFWLEYKTNIDHPYETGIYWTKWIGSGWQTEQNLAPCTGPLPVCYGGPEGVRDLRRYYFDVAVVGDGEIILVLCQT